MELKTHPAIGLYNKKKKKNYTNACNSGYYNSNI